MDKFLRDRTAILDWPEIDTSVKVSFWSSSALCFKFFNSDLEFLTGVPNRLYKNPCDPLEWKSLPIAMQFFMKKSSQAQAVQQNLFGLPQTVL
jgi:hypothetical protein